MLGFGRRRDREQNAGLREGDTVKLDVSPFDFSAGRIRGAGEGPAKETGSIGF